MPLPKLNDTQIGAVIQQVAKYIASQRQTYRGNASPLDQNERPVLAPFFRESVLDSTRIVVLTDQRVSNPGLYSGLVTMGFEPGSLPDFTEMAAITFVDTIVSHGPIANRTLFHELVHLVQYEKLGLPQFAAKYVK